MNCGIVHVYVSYDNSHPSPVLYSDKVTATDGHPAILYINQTVAGRPVYLAFVGTQLPPEAAGLKNCSDSNFTATFTEGNTGGNTITYFLLIACSKLAAEFQKRWSSISCSLDRKAQRHSSRMHAGKFMQIKPNTGHL